MESTDRDDVVVALADGVLLLDVAGPVQVLHWARRRVRFASLDGGPVRTDVGAPLGADCAFAEVAARIDTLLVPGFAPDDRPDSRLVAAVGALAGRARRVAAVCTGAFVLAEAGLLDGRRATTHWMGCGELARRFPRVAVQPDAIYVRDGGVVTSAGVTAGIDMALALVEEDQGQELARTVAKQLVVFLRRPGGLGEVVEHARLVDDEVRELADPGLDRLPGSRRADPGRRVSRQGKIIRAGPPPAKPPRRPRRPKP
ncbi:AraC family transcriptional regulator, partial [Nocardia farcinica]|uniref:AraC family transcriptional regulator n=1 Tax=Nocardia farcinica TaxID=37329 RepID=UPI0024561FA5